MPDKPTLYVCHIADGGPPPPACRRAHEALREAGHDYESVVFAKGHRFGLFTTGRRPKLKEISGQDFTARDVKASIELASGATKKKTVDVKDSKHDAGGPFALQYGSGVIKFRKLYIKPL